MEVVDMPEIEFKIDMDSGTCQTEIKGYRGPACEKAALQLKELLGDATSETKKQEYFVSKRIRQTSSKNG